MKSVVNTLDTLIYAKIKFLFSITILLFYCFTIKLVFDCFFYSFSFDDTLSYKMELLFVRIGLWRQSDLFVFDEEGKIQVRPVECVRYILFTIRVTEFYFVRSTHMFPSEYLLCEILLRLHLTHFTCITCILLAKRPEVTEVFAVHPHGGDMRGCTMAFGDFFVSVQWKPKKVVRYFLRKS